MSARIKDSRNFLVGAMFATVGTAAILIGRDYELGTAGRMGPAYFPSIIGLLLVLVGVAGIVRSLLAPGEPMERFAVRQLALVGGAVVAFALLLRGAGLVPAVIVLVMGSGYASRDFHAGRFAMLAAGLALFASLVFIQGLGLPLQAFGTWFGA
jgi:hypothetical protein